MCCYKIKSVVFLLLLIVLSSWPCYLVSLLILWPKPCVFFQLFQFTKHYFTYNKSPQQRLRYFLGLLPFLEFSCCEKSLKSLLITSCFFDSPPHLYCIGLVLERDIFYSPRWMFVLSEYHSYLTGKKFSVNSLDIAHITQSVVKITLEFTFSTRITQTFAPFNSFSFIFTSAFFLVRVARAPALRGLEYLTVFSHQWLLHWLHSITEPSKIWDVITPPGLCSNSGTFFHRCTRQDLPRHSFFGIFWSRNRTIVAGILPFGREVTLQWKVVRILQMCVSSHCHLVKSSYNPISSASLVLEVTLVHSFLKIHDHKWGLEERPI